MHYVLVFLYKYKVSHNSIFVNLLTYACFSFFPTFPMAKIINFFYGILLSGIYQTSVYSIYKYSMIIYYRLM